MGRFSPESFFRQVCLLRFMARVSLGTKLDCKLPEVSKPLGWKEIRKVECAAEHQVSSGQCASDMVHHTFRFC